MNDKEKNIEEVLDSLTFDDAPDRGHRDVLQQKLLLNFNAVRTRQESKWRIVMNNKMHKFAAAAVVMIGLFVSYQLLTGTSNDLWAQVGKRVAAVAGVTCKATVTGIEQGQAYEIRMEMIQSEEYGMSMDAYMGDKMVNRTYILVDERSHITLFPDQKKYLEVELTEKIQWKNGGPKAMVQAFLESDYKELGSSTINGVAVEGIESSDISPDAGFPGGSGFVDSVEGKFYGTVLARLWVDVATGWPVEVTLEISDQNNNIQQMTVVVSDFQWDAQIDPDVFTSVIPDGYKLMYSIKAGRLESGEQIVDGLAYFAKINGGKYPAKFTIGDILGEVGNIYKTRSSDPSFQIDDVQIVNLKYGAQYFARLQSQGKDPAYFGATVTAADTDKVLLRWELDGGRYRVIFGDLRIVDISSDKSAQLQAD